jgi:predicted Zn-ribbon and HTH transcriptional regulator
MSLVQKLKSAIGSDESFETTTYECRDCGATHDSAKTPDRASCPECLSNDVTQV